MQDRALAGLATLATLASARACADGSAMTGRPAQRGQGHRRGLLPRYFFLDDGDRAMVAAQRGDHNRLGFGIQLATVRYVGRFQPDPLEGVPTEAIDFLADQLEIADRSCVKNYALRQETHREHAGKIQKALKLKDFSQVEADLPVFAGGRAWVTGAGPKAIFATVASLPAQGRFGWDPDTPVSDSPASWVDTWAWLFNRDPG